MRECEESDQTFGEEIANAVTHGLGAVLSLAGLVYLVVLASLNGTALHIVSVAVYGTTLVLLYSASTLYHAVRGPRRKAFCNLLDHAAIYLLIAGTYTPFTLVSLGGAWGWSLFVTVWVLAVAGVILRTVLGEHERRISVPLYLAMGWLAMTASGEFWGRMPPGALLWLVVGGLAYSLGTIFYAWNRLPFNHTVWHLFVLAGSACHFLAVTRYVLPGT